MFWDIDINFLLYRRASVFKTRGPCSPYSPLLILLKCCNPYFLVVLHQCVLMSSSQAYFLDDQIRAYVTSCMQLAQSQGISQDNWSPPFLDQVDILLSWLGPIALSQGSYKVCQVSAMIARQQEPGDRGDLTQCAGRLSRHEPEDLAGLSRSCLQKRLRPLEASCNTP